MRFLIALLLVALCLDAGAQAYPAKPVRVLVPFPPGGTADLLTRQATSTEEPGERLRLFEALGDMALMMLHDDERVGTAVRREEEVAKLPELSPPAHDVAAE